MSPAAEKIIDRLDSTRQQWWIFTLLSTAVWAISVSFAVALVFMLADALARFSQDTLAGLLAVWAAVTILMAIFVLRRITRSQRSIEATARCIETEYPELGSSLINVVQLSSDTKNESRPFCEAAVNEAAAQAGKVRFEDAARHETRWRRFLYCMQSPRDLVESIVVFLLLFAIGLLSQWLNPNVGSAAGRLMQPWRFVPSVGSLKILEVTPGDTEVLLGESLDIAAVIVDRIEGDPYPATLYVAFDDGKETDLPMTPGERYVTKTNRNGETVDETRRSYTLTLPTVKSPMTYRLEIGDSQTRVYRVAVTEKPTVDEVEVTLKYPIYLGRAEETFVQKTADLEVPQYTIAELQIRPSVPITKGHLDAEGMIYSGELRSGGKLMLVRMPLVKNTTFTIHLEKNGQADPHPRLNRVIVHPDRPPTIELLKPPRQSTAAPGSDLAVMIRSADDHGVGRVRLEMKVNDESAVGTGDETSETADKNTTVVKQWTEFDNDSTIVLHHLMALAGDVVRPGQTVLLRATVRDRRMFNDFGLELVPQESVTGWHTVRIVDEQAKVDAVLAKLDNLRDALFRILDKQLRATARNALIGAKTRIDEAVASAAVVRSLQVDIQKSSIALVRLIGDVEREDHQAIKRILNQLAFGEMLTAVSQCDTLVKAKVIDELPVTVGELGLTQATIIDILRKMLDITRRAQTEELAEMKNRQVGDLPPEAQKKLDDLNNALEKAMEQQKKVVEAAENLAKAPVEDFAEAKEQLVKALQAAEDDWSKFMTELNTDLSKLPEQDFANPSSLKELVEIQTEIKMAEDALLKKTADIAVPLEQLGAEMAEEIQTNMEKWLPDEPDRERWSQEESLTDEGKEAPMAELPGELEDLIGDLLEEEEDLFDEMEDVSSSAADSLDKGAGWDVMDGPISNMSAKGATGNRLPNASEIGGRAGEGRQGKSSGEFVGDEAVGKGGRKTPSRLTPDPYVNGQIKDHSKDPSGGATGGGKESGEGGEGLEGPTPGSRGERDMNRLAGKQAALRNKAEGIDLQHYKVMGYHHIDLARMIDLMGQIERDLRAGRYQNAIRQRDVLLEGLGGVKQHLEGKFEVRRDETVNLPADVQKDLFGSMQDPSPAGWEEMNRKYFERLARGGADAGPSLTGTSREAPTLTESSP
jgi:tetratricopeptide (TPR) repeat protein